MTFGAWKNRRPLVEVTKGSFATTTSGRNSGRQSPYVNPSALSRSTLSRRTSHPSARASLHRRRHRFPLSLSLSFRRSFRLPQRRRSRTPSPLPPLLALPHHIHKGLFKGWWEFSMLILPVEWGLHETMSLNLKPECSDRRLGLCYSLGFREERDEIEVDDMIEETDPMIAMLNDIACGLAPGYTSCETEGAGGSNPRSSADEEAMRYFEILDDAQTELYPGCKDFSKLSFIVELLHLKALNQWSDTSFDMLLQLLLRVLPSGAKLAESYYQARKLTENLDFTY
ncbi:hypothetical protein MRB53_008980 [Persea americana]|uniref:Uncharacterized protein n=1 Tax=Persea americana TaxID=3435 RepID=A0ACC2LNB2_PERAE|nr:hypothetical protein MRB53_008980 [Persea americana]